jgi:chromosome partitioning protein
VNHDAPLRVIWPARAHVIVVSSGKATAGKTTLALNLASALVRAAQKVGVIDLDSSALTLSRMLSARRDQRLEVAAPAEARAFSVQLQDLSARCAYVIIDAPSIADERSPLAYACADTLVTLVSRSAELGSFAPGAALTPSGFSEMVWEGRKQKARARGGPIDWVVLRNCIGRADAKDDAALTALSARIGFRVAPGLMEREIVRALFGQGRDLLDSAARLSMSHVAARQEFREFLLTLKLPELRAAAAA